MARPIGHTEAKIPRTCRLCGNEFLAKHPQAKVCPEDGCQRKAKAERDKRKYERRKAREAEAQKTDA